MLPLSGTCYALQWASLPDGQGGQKEVPLSPREYYRHLSETVKRALTERGIDRPTLSVNIPLPKKAKVLFQIHEETRSLKAVIGGAPFIGAALRVFGFSPAPVPRSPKMPSTSLSPTVKAGVVGALVAGAAAVTVTSYQLQVRELRAEILQAYNNIGDDTVTQEMLLQSTHEIMAKKEASYFKKIFEYYNPNPISCLLLVKGVALDSQRDFAAAQQQYRTGLQHATEPELRNILLFAFARSLRLSGASQAAVLEQVNQINQDSPIRVLGIIEGRAAGEHGDEVFEEDQTPAEFMCPITEDIMVEPTFYTANGHRFYYEGSAIRGWINEGGTCPETRAPLALDQLQTDERLVEAIRIWNQFKLKRG